MHKPSPPPRAHRLGRRDDDPSRPAALVLVAAGDRRARARLGGALRRSGYRVVVAATGAELLALAGEQRPDLVVADIRTARCDWLELVPHLHDTLETGVVLVGAAGGEGVARAAEAGADACLCARVPSGELLETVRAVLAERELRRERGLSSALLDQAPDATVMVDASGRIAVVNPALERLFGYREEELVGEPLEVLLPESLRARHAAHRAAYARAPRPRPMGRGLDLVGLRADGSEIAIDVSLGPVSVGGEDFVLATIRDVSERRRAEAEERALRRVATAVAAEAGPDDVFSLVAEEAAALLGADAGRVSRFEGEQARVVGAWGAEEPPVGTVSPLSGGRAVAQVARKGRAARVDDYARVRRHDPNSRHVPAASYRSGVAAPVRVEGRLWGAVTVVSTARERAFPPGAEERLGRFCELVGVAVANAEQRAALARGAAEQSALREVATLVASDPQPRAVFALVAERAARVLGVEWGLVTRFEPTGQGRAVGSWAAPAEPRLVPGSLVGLDGGDATSRVAHSGRPARTETAGRRGLACPVRVEGRIWGAVAVASSGDEPWGPDAEERLAGFADLVALAVAGAEAREQLTTLASTDHLTGLYNHRAFMERLGEEVQRARRHGRTLSLVVFDLDHFKLVNDTFGHQVGNRVLAEAADRLRRQVRGGEVLARVGGEEFAWILPETDGIGAVAAAERARAALAAEPFRGAGHLTTSAGVCDLTEASDPGELFRLADTALYWAKAQGRDRVFRYARAALELLPAEEQARRLERARTLAAVRALAVAVDAKEPQTQRHSERVADLAQRIALAAGWPAARAGLLHEAALVHDVGKIALPDAILLKPSALTEDEYAAVKEHAVIGAQMVAEALSPEQVNWVRFHHERYDGRGYPTGLAGERIPEGARLLGLADAWDAMTAARPYGAPRPFAEALAECHHERGGQFCPRAVAALDRVLRGETPSAEPRPARGLGSRP